MEMYPRIVTLASTRRKKVLDGCCTNFCCVLAILCALLGTCALCFSNGKEEVQLSVITLLVSFAWLSLLTILVLFRYYKEKTKETRRNAQLRRLLGQQQRQQDPQSEAPSVVTEQIPLRSPQRTWYDDVSTSVVSEANQEQTVTPSSDSPVTLRVTLPPTRDEVVTSVVTNTNQQRTETPLSVSESVPLVESPSTPPPSYESVLETLDPPPPYSKCVGEIGTGREQTNS